MSDTTQKSSEELAAELEKLMPKVRSNTAWWKCFIHITQIEATSKHLWLVAQLVLAQQEEIKQLKAELDELKNR